MADYVVSDTSLTAVANAIRTKGGTSAQLAFPAEFISAIEAISGGGGYTPEDFAYNANPSGALVITDPSVTSLPQYRFYYRTAVTSAHFSALTSIPTYCFDHCNELTTFVGRSVESIAGYGLGHTAKLTKIDITSAGSFAADSLRECKPSTLHIIMRGDTLKTLASNGFRGSGVVNTTAVTFFVNKSVYDHLGTGDSLDYEAATNWSTIATRSNVSFAQIEGSQYDGYYADGTPIPTE